MYCGDETGAFIGDVGAHTARFGYGGEDCPKVVIPSAVYYSRSSSSNNDNNEGGGTRSTYAPHYHGKKNSSNARHSKHNKYSAPVSLLRIPPDGCFSSSSSNDDDDGDATEGGVGFIPIYQSLNSNNRGTTTSTTNANNDNDNGLIQDIDAWASAWEYSYESLCVRGKGKHTMGHKYHLEPELHPEGVSSSSIQSNMEGGGGGIPIDHPLLAVDSTSRTLPTQTAERQRSLMLEVLFEQLSAPAAYIAPSPMLSSFAYGRQTSLVVDIGHAGSRVTPLVDGYCLNVGSVSSRRGGRWLGNIQKSVLEGVGVGDAGDVHNNANATTTTTATTTCKRWNGWGDGKDESSRPPCHDEGVIPRYLLHSNMEKLPNDKLELVKRSPFHSMAIHEVMYEMMTSSHILPLEFNGGGGSEEEEDAASAPFCRYGGEDDDDDGTNTGGVDDDAMAVDMEEDKKEEEDADSDFDEEGRSRYVLPDGTRVDLAKSRAGEDLRRLPELLFSETLPSFVKTSTNNNSDNNNNMLPLQQLVHESLSQILDADLRKELSSNIIVTGGASLFPGLDKFLSAKLGEVLPSSYKYKVIASKNSVENRYSAWIGGSILSSLGSFQQLWLSKKEYEECGAYLGLQRFKN